MSNTIKVLLIKCLLLIFFSFNQKITKICKYLKLNTEWKNSPSLTSCLACSCSTAVIAGCTSLTWGRPCGSIPGGSLLPKPPRCGRLPSSSSPCPSSYVKTVVNKLSALHYHTHTPMYTLTHANNKQCIIHYFSFCVCKRFKQNKQKMVQAQADFVELIAMEILFRLGMKTHSNIDGEEKDWIHGSLHQKKNNKRHADRFNFFLFRLIRMRSSRIKINMRITHQAPLKTQHLSIIIKKLTYRVNRSGWNKVC